MGKRIKTKYVGIYYRHSDGRVLLNGKPDKCFDIHYKAKGKDIFEKVGWTSEGYTIEDAIELRGVRVRALRHPELSEQIRGKSRKQPTVDEIWGVYKDKWLPNLKNKTKCISMYEVHIQPVFGNKRVDRISKLDIENFKLKLFSANTKRKIPLQPGTVRMILIFFKSMIEQAKSWELVHDLKCNPVGKIDIKDSNPQRERYLTPKEAKKLLDACQHIDCQTYFIACIGLYTGMRLGEILSLTGEQIDITGGVIALNGKTGRRSAYIPDELKPLFQKLMPDTPGDFIFYDANGKQIASSTYSARFARVVNIIGLNDGIVDNINKVVFHTLRHTYCSWLAIEGVPLYTIGQLVGHSKPEMTQRYAKLSPDSKRAAIQGIGAKLGDKTES